MTSANFLGYGMNCDTFDPDYPNVGNGLFNSYITALDNLCETLPIIFADISSPFHSLCVCLILSRILNLAYLALISGCTQSPYQMSSRAFVLIYFSSESSYI